MKNLVGYKTASEADIIDHIKGAIQREFAQVVITTPEMPHTTSPLSGWRPLIALVIVHQCDEDKTETVLETTRLIQGLDLETAENRDDRMGSMTGQNWSNLM